MTMNLLDLIRAVVERREAANLGPGGMVLLKDLLEVIPTSQRRDALRRVLNHLHNKRVIWVGNTINDRYIRILSVEKSEFLKSDMFKNDVKPLKESEMNIPEFWVKGNIGFVYGVGILVYTGENWVHVPYASYKNGKYNFIS